MVGVFWWIEVKFCNLIVDKKHVINCEKTNRTVR